MAATVDPHYQDRLQALRDKYAASVPERMAAIRAGLAHCLSGGLTTANLEELHHALHSVAGSAGSFGLHVLGDEARRIEQMVRPMLTGETSGWEAIPVAVEALLHWADKDFRAAKFAAHD